MVQAYYQKVVIESAIEAVALPVGTVAYGDTGEYPRSKNVAIKDEHGLWYTTAEQDFILDEYMVGWTALIPITLDEIFKEYDQELDELPDVMGVDFGNKR